MESPLTQAQLDLLNTPLRPDEIEHKQGMSYLKGQLAIVKANRIFGVGNWSYRQLGPIEITDTGIDNSRKNRIFLVSATVELTIRGCETFVEQGDCESQGMGAPALSMARKGAVTDGVKRCLKNLGAAFGLDLYFAEGAPPAEQKQTNQQPPTQAARPPATQNAVRPKAYPTPAPQAPVAAPARPVTQPSTPIVTPAATGELATDQQIQAIARMAGRKGVDDIQLNDRLTELYGVELKSLTRNDASHFIKVFQGQA